MAAGFHFSGVELGPRLKNATWGEKCSFHPRRCEKLRSKLGQIGSQNHGKKHKWVVLFRDRNTKTPKLPNWGTKVLHNFLVPISNFSVNLKNHMKV